MANTIQLKRGTAAAWTSNNPTLANGEAGFESDTGKLKIGDGSTEWNSLDYISGDSSGGSLTYETEITVASTTFNGTQKGLNTIYPFNSASAQTVQIDNGDYIENDVINIERRGQGTLQIVQGTDVRFRGVRDANNEFFVNDANSMVALICRGNDGTNDEFSIIGNLKRGYIGAVTTSSYGILRENDTGVDVNVVGTGFSDNMLVSVSANATLNSFVVNSSTSLTLNLDAVGVEDDTVTVTYDNGDIFVDTDAITILAESATVYDTYPFDYGWALFKLRNGVAYSLRVRRSSDDAETDVGFNSSDVVALDSPVSAGGTLTSWAGSDDVFVVKRYNQATTGSTFDLAQSDTTKQAKLLSSGALIQQDARTFIEFDGTNDVYVTSGTDTWRNNDLTIFADVRSKSAASGQILGYFPSTATERMLQYRYDATNVIRATVADEGGLTGNVTADSASTSINTNYDLTLVEDNSNITHYINGSSSGTPQSSPASRPTESNPFEHGGLISLNTTFLDGYNNYVIVYKSDESANISGIQTILNTSL